MTREEAIDKVMELIRAEMERQVEKWGVQHHPNGTGGLEERCAAAIATAVCDETYRDGSTTWKHIQKEEYHEAMAEDNDEFLGKELVQNAAVSASWIVDILTRTENEGLSLEVDE